MHRIEEIEGATYLIPDRDSAAMLHRRWHSTHVAMKAIPLFVENRKVCIQAGGNWGLWPLRLASMFETVYTFEPDHACFTALVANCREKENVITIQAGLGYNRALVGLWRDVDTTGSQTVDRPGIYPIFRVDDLALPKCDLIYLDIEGMEMDAVMGAQDTLARCKPIIIFEETKKYDVGSQVRKVLESHFRYFQLGTIGRDVVMGPNKPTHDFEVQRMELDEKTGELVEVE